MACRGRHRASSSSDAIAARLLPTRRAAASLSWSSCESPPPSPPPRLLQPALLSAASPWEERTRICRRPSPLHGSAQLAALSEAPKGLGRKVPPAEAPFLPARTGGEVSGAAAEAGGGERRAVGSVRSPRRAIAAARSPVADWRAGGSAEAGRGRGVGVAACASHWLQERGAGRGVCVPFGPVDHLPGSERADCLGWVWVF